VPSTDPVSQPAARQPTTDATEETPVEESAEPVPASAAPADIPAAAVAQTSEPDALPDAGHADEDEQLPAPEPTPTPIDEPTAPLIPGVTPLPRRPPLSSRGPSTASPVAPEPPAARRLRPGVLAAAAVLVGVVAAGVGTVLVARSGQESADEPPATTLAATGGTRPGGPVVVAPGTSIEQPSTTLSSPAQPTTPSASSSELTAPPSTPSSVSPNTAANTTPGTQPSTTTTSTTAPEIPTTTIVDGVVIEEASLTPTVTAAAASDVRPNSQDACGNPTTYQPGLAVDGTNDTAWMVEGDGTGQSIRLALAGLSVVTRVGLVPGYDKFDPCTGSERFDELRRITAVRWAFDDGSTIDQTVEPIAEMQEIRLPRAAVTASVTMTVLATVGPGDQNLDNTAVSEISIA
jgi:hypothetical protein